MSDKQQHNTNTFLKNLSQKKYAWMEEAAPPKEPTSSESSPRTPSTANTPTKKTVATKKSRSSPDSDPSLVALPTIATTANANKKHKSSPNHVAQPIKNEEVEMQQVEIVRTVEKPKLPQPKFKYTTFPVKGYNILPTRNITSSFARGDATYFPGNKAGAEAISPDPEQEWTDTIIIHPGSRNLRIGFASEAFPICVPHVIARRFNTKATSADEDMDAVTEEQEVKYEEALREIKGELKWRMKNAKRRAVPNAEAQVIGFNTSAFKETILDHNDPYKVEWTEAKNSDYFVGEKAINLPIAKESKYTIKYPWKYGTLNHWDYSSINMVLSDLEAIWTSTIVTDLQIERSEFKNYNVAIVIPDTFNHAYLVEIVTVLLRFMNFKGVIIEQESLCATYGAGVSSAVVVDIGSQTTKICCIEDGVCQVESRITIDLGGDDITKTFTSFLLKNKFPYQEINLSHSFDWRLAQDLKEKWCTMNEADISVQVYDFFARTPFKPTLKYQCKVYDEVFLAPLCLVYPDILNRTTNHTEEFNWGANSSNVTDDIVEDNSKSCSQKYYHQFPIDIAISQSIINAANGSDEKLKRYFTSIILVGGGAKISNFSKVLEDRVLSTILAQKAYIDKVEVLPAPRELDPEVLVWKGASVMSKLDTAKDMWIGKEEWDQIGAKCIRSRSLLL